MHCCFSGSIDRAHCAWLLTRLSWFWLCTLVAKRTMLLGDCRLYYYHRRSIFLIQRQKNSCLSKSVFVFMSINHEVMCHVPNILAHAHGASKPHTHIATDHRYRSRSEIRMLFSKPNSFDFNWTCLIKTKLRSDLDLDLEKKKPSQIQIQTQIRSNKKEGMMLRLRCWLLRRRPLPVSCQIGLIESFCILVC
jgi:hypothetical protein